MKAGTILLVDDHEAVRSVGKRMLERLGFTVLTADDGREALETYAAIPQRFDCVLLDLTMPRMDGVECFRELRRIDGSVRVVLSSGYDELDVAQRFAGKRPAGFIQKPFQLHALGQILDAVLSGRAG